MVVIAVAGGTGLAGRAVIEHGVATGCTMRSLSRQLPEIRARVSGAEYVRADFRSGDGVADGLAGVDAVVETLDARSGASLKAMPALTADVLAASRRAGVRRCVLLTIARADECSLGYYQVQAARARNYERAELPTSVVYATQFHNLVSGIFATGAKVGLIPAFRGVSFQSISTSDVARVLLAEAVEGEALRSEVIAGGPAVATMKALAQEWKAVTGSKAMVSAVPLPGAFGAFLRLGKNLVPEHAVGNVGFGEWLQLQH
ncbi:NAD(P)H-binding protein [Arthrobacter sp. H35-D1]|uniref:SDR family oxidoreductase n=1 Tax=Arthrobacter sp. H35-D1 TaxID=3046202 RepID=UPI0024B9E819|nr:NAD(P)H-binding protein [Arthrobacter sp. H35-D1]MDJ0315398.1 NAD(P)H-binding protein [Arthrobacter sp. H35-D1]